MRHYCILFRFSEQFMQKGLLLPDERVTTFEQKGYGILKMYLFVSWFRVISVLFRVHFILKEMQ